MILYARSSSYPGDQPHGTGATSARILAVAIAGMLVTSAQQARAGDGFDWQEWKKITTWTLTDVPTDQAGKAALAPLLETEGKSRMRIDDLTPWETKRAKILDAVRAVLGEPTGLKIDPVEVQSTNDHTLGDHLRRCIRIRSEPEDWITAYLLIPKDPPDSPGPAVICLHDLPGNKEALCDVARDNPRALAVDLVRRGYVCLVPDMIGCGERGGGGDRPFAQIMDFYRKHNRWSVMGKQTWDTARAVDYLMTLPSVDKRSIGVLGHGYGGTAALLAAAMDPRIALVISDQGLPAFRNDPAPDRWSRHFPLLPQIDLYLPDIERIPFDWHEVCATIAPRPLYVTGAEKAGRLILGQIDRAVSPELRNVYGLYGAADDLGESLDTEPAHPLREIVEKWLPERLFRTGNLYAIPKDVAGWEQQRSIIRRVVRRTIGTVSGPPPSLELKTLATRQCPRYERRLVEYSVAKDDRVRAYLCIPSEAGKPAPAILALNGTWREGKDVTMGLANRTEAREFAFAPELAERGYIVLVPDCVVMGERIDKGGYCNTKGVYQRNPGVSIMAKMLYDDQRALDLLLTVDGVDHHRIGSIGLSLGGQRALFLAAFDERVKATVCSVGTTMFVAESHKTRLNMVRDHSGFSYFPRLRPAIQQGQFPPWDWDLLIRLVAPRGFFHQTRDQDPYAPRSIAVYEACDASRPVWDLFGQPHDRLVNVHEPGPHGMAQATKLKAYDWLDRQLGKVTSPSR